MNGKEIETDMTELITTLSTETDPDVSAYADILCKGGIGINELRSIASNRSVRMQMMDSGAIEISFRKGDHTAVTVITADGDVRTTMKDCLFY